MKKIKVDPSVGMHTLINFLKTDKTDSDILFFFTRENEIYKNVANLQILKNMATEHGKTLVFEVENPIHKDFIESVNQETLAYTDEPVELKQKQTLLDKISSFFVKYTKSRKSLPKNEQSEQRFKKKKNPKNMKRKIKFIKPILIILVVLVLLVGSAILFYINIPSAVVTLTLDSEGLVKLINVKADPGIDEIDVENGIIPVLEVSVTETDTMAIPTTGEKETGDKATGEITIYNKTSEDKTFDKGTKIKLISKDKDNLIYVTTKEVKVPAKTETPDPDDPTVPPTVEYGTKTVKIEASKYGDEYNLKSDQTFKIDDRDTDEFVGGNDEKISGGTSKIVHVVTQKDIDDLSKLLESSLEDKAKRSLKQKIVEGQSLNEGSIVTSITKKEFDSELGDQVDNLSLTMTIEASGLAYKIEDLDAVVNAMAKKSIPEKFDWDGKSDEYEVAVVKSPEPEDKTLNLQVKLTVHITPKVNKSRIADELSGMKLNEAEKYLSNLNNIKEYSIKFKNMPSFFVRMPLKPVNIKVELVNQ